MSRPTESNAVACLPVPQLLLIPELLMAILEHLDDDQPALYAACRVSRLWASFSLGIL